MPFIKFSAPLHLHFAIHNLGRLGVALLLMSTSTWATVTIQLQAGELKNADGSPMPSTGLILLVASTSDDSFAAPTDNDFTPGDDLEIFRGNLQSVASSGNFNAIITPLELGNGWDAGDRLAIYWFPTLEPSVTTPGSATPYGIYAPAAGEELDGSHEWITPVDGGTITIKYLNADASIAPVVSGGSHSVASGRASLLTSGGGSNGGSDGDTSGGGSGDDGNASGPAFSLDRALGGIGWEGSGNARYAEWFGISEMSGIYFTIGDDNGWTFHNELGWIYVIAEDSSSVWYYDIESDAFWWTASGVYPVAYNADTNTWMQIILRGDDGQRWFYNANTETTDVLGNIFD